MRCEEGDSNPHAFRQRNLNRDLASRTGTNRVISGAAHTQDAPLQTPRPESVLIQARPDAPRARAIADLTARIAEAAAVGDMALARILGRALSELLEDGSST